MVDRTVVVHTISRRDRRATSRRDRCAITDIAGRSPPDIYRAALHYHHDGPASAGRATDVFEHCFGDVSVISVWGSLIRHAVGVSRLRSDMSERTPLWYHNFSAKPLDKVPRTTGKLLGRVPPRRHVIATSVVKHADKKSLRLTST